MWRIYSNPDPHGGFDTWDIDALWRDLSFSTKTFDCDLDLNFFSNFYTRKVTFRWAVLSTDNSCSKKLHVVEMDWLFDVLCPTGEFFTNYWWRGAKLRPFSEPLRWEGSLSCHTCCDTGLQVFQSHPIDCPILLPCARGCWGPIPTWILMGKLGDTIMVECKAVIQIRSMRWSLLGTRMRYCFYRWHWPLCRLGGDQFAPFCLINISCCD
jgi:hypothetical protein